MLKKKSIYLSIVASMLLICALLCTSCSLFFGKIHDELPKENIVKIEKITLDVTNGEETISTLSADKIDEFFNILNEIEYTRYYNIRGVKYIPFADVSYVLHYETHTVKLSEYQFSIYTGEELQKTMRFQKVSPIDKYNQLKALFEI